MADSKYEEKFEEMQKFLPFLSKVIERLKQSDRGEDSPRKAQLQKMQMLYDLLTVKSKKLKMETLLKCEGILIKLHANMEKCNDNDISKISGTNRQDTSNIQNDVIDITGPESPPSQEIEVVQPVLIPTERQFSPITASEYFRKDDNRQNDERRHRDNRRRHHRYGKDGHDRLNTTAETSCEVNKYKVKTNSVVDTIDLVCDSPSPTRSVDNEKTVRTSDYNCKSRYYDTHKKIEKGVFERLGGKVDNKLDSFRNFKVNICNDLADTKLKHSTSSSNESSEFPAILDSSPLSPTKILNLFNDSTDNLSSSSSNLSISNIGTRRPPKEPLENINEPQVSDLDAVRKKLAMISRNSPQLEESPPAPPPFTSPTETINERGIRTYPNNGPSKPYVLNPADIYAKTICNNLPPSSSINILPSVNPQDPRLRKVGALNNVMATASIQSNFTSVYPQGNFGFNVPTVEVVSRSVHQSQNDMRYSAQVSSSYQREDPRLKHTSGRQCGSYNDYCRTNNHRIDHTNNEPNRTYGHNRTTIYNKPPLLENPQNVRTTIYNKPSLLENPQNARFNALRNDKTERFKYFESKKQKSSEPRTYGEFKAAKARAAAEEAAKKPVTLKNVAEGVNKRSTDFQMSNDITNTDTTTTDTSALAHCSSESTLDKLYRSSNFSAADFPNKLITFKIPKKPSTRQKNDGSDINEKTKDVINEKPKEIVNENSKEIVNEKLKDNVDEKYKDTINKDSDECNNRESEYSKPITNTPQLEKPIKHIKSQNIKCNELAKESEENDVIEVNCKIKCSNESNKFDENKIHLSETNFDIKNNTKESTETAKSKEFEGLKPRRILARRSTMISYDSVPEIDKEKICLNNALLYEDVQERLATQQKPENEDKPNIKRNKALADMFRKTDDNCMISTENIITGKRRTRTTVNFNEVQQAKAAFKQVDLKKDTKDVRKPKETIMNENASKKKNVVENRRDSEQKACARSTTESIVSLSPNSSTSYVEENDSECSGSATSRSTTAMSQPDEKSKKEMLENFVQSLLKPNADKKYIFGLLEQILDNEKMTLVKQILDDDPKPDEAYIKEVQQQKLNEISEESEHNNDKEKFECSADLTKDVPTKRKTRKRNELDRLNDDIRDMFICEGVLTATGRRMCTLVAAEGEKETTVLGECLDSEKKRNVVKELTPRIRRSKVVLTPLNLNNIRKSARFYDQPVSETSNTESESILSDSLMGTTDLSEKIEDDSSIVSETPPRKMPVLKPNTPIKLPEEEDSMPLKETVKPKAKERKLKIKLTRVKPCPKSKKLLAMARASKYANKSSKTPNRINSHKIKKNKPKEADVKNVNLNWHSLSRYAKYCGICNTNSQYIGIHYKQTHGEHYTSRLAPGILEKYKDRSKSKPDFSTMNKKDQFWFYCCPFCLKHSSKTLQQWIIHFGTHTCEYKFECSKCFKGSRKRNIIHKHCGNKLGCANAHVIENDIFAAKKLDTVKAHVCHLCNFIQILRTNLDKHYIEQHDCKPSIVGSMGYTIDLINMRKVPVVDAQKAIEMEESIFSTAQSSITLQSDNDDNDEDDYLNSSGDSGHSLLAVLEVRDVFEEDSRSNRTAKKQGKVGAAKKVGRPKASESSPKKIKVELVQDNHTIANLDFDKGKRVNGGSNVNAFMPTRDTTDSPTLAENLRCIEQEEAEANNKNILASKSNVSVSIAERLSQRIRNFSDHEIALERMINADDFTQLSPNKIPVNPLDMSDNLVVENEVLKESLLTPDTVTTLTHMDLGYSKNNPTVEDKDIEQQDDDNWEDIEVIESAPSTNSSINSSTSATRDSRNKNKQLFQKYSRFCNAMGPLNKPKKAPIIKKKNVSTTDLGELTVEPLKSVEPTDVVTASKTADAALPFRPMIMTLEDLLPNSPSNDPQELVPELAPLEPLKDLNDISRVLERNANALNASVSSTALEVNKNLTTLKPSNIPATSIIQNTCTQLIIHRIQNIGYSNTKNPETGCRFYCLSEKCTFLYSSEAIGLENHYLSEHSQIKWNGYCGTCKQQVVVNQSELPLPFSCELQHTLEKHVVQIVQEKGVEKKIESLQSEVDNETKEEKPRIKIRRLSGDCLSTTPTNRGTPDMEDLDSNEVSTDCNTKLRDLLNVQTKPPAIITPNSVQIPGKSVTTITAREMIEPLIQKLSNKVIVKMISPKSSAASTSATSVVPSSSSSLQIAKVISLNNGNNTKNVDNLNSQQLPKIANVCSLNKSKQVSSTDILWEQQIQDECIELANSAAESLELSRLLANASKPQQNISIRTQVSDSPEPVVVSETVPVAQAKSGNFVITQTVSAQYNNTTEGVKSPQLGFNISIAATSPKAATLSKAAPRISTAQSVPNVVKINEGTKVVPGKTQTLHMSFVCMGSGCSYQTRVMVAMKDHLQFHERRNFNFNQRDYMRCSLCDYLAEDVDDYFNHAGQDHQRFGGLNSSKQTMENSFKQKLIETIKEIIPLTGIKDAELYRCVVAGCKSVLTESTYYNHLSYHSYSLPNVKEYHYTCLYCSASYQKPAGIKAHIKLHARHRYFCYICMSTAASADQLLKHFSENHLRTMNLHTAILLEQLDLDNDGQEKTDYLVASNQSLSNLEVQQFREKLIIDWQRRKAESKTHFKSTQIQMLPKHPIFTKEVHCAECPYKTKVRTNMLRHLQMHCFNAGTNGSGSIAQPVMASVDPINPVPCLNSSERHFDKMTNLASSSLVTNSGGNNNNSTTATVSTFKIQYAYIPETRRYTCGVQPCQYLTISDDIFRIHLSTLHGDILLYKCPFCQEDICKRTMSTERILQHLRYHGARLYRCEECNYIHYMKSVVERHITERHPEQRVHLVSHIRTEDNTLEGMTTSQSYIGKRTKDANSKANKGQKAPPVGSQSKQDGIVRDIVKPAIDTRPLWIRDDPARVRHIRGILMENEEESEQHRRSLSSLYEEDDDVDESVHKSDTFAVSSRTEHLTNGTTNDLVLGIYEFACFQCEFVRRNFDEINQHWKETHKRDELGVTRPFLCRLLPQLKCPTCNTFTGNHLQLQLHFEEEHQSSSFMAVDTRSSKLTCGFCYLNFQNTVTLLRHHRRELHDSQDIKLLTSEHLEKLLQLGTRTNDECYIQCKVCNEVFANAYALQLHLRSKHDDDALKIGHTELRNVLIYCCPVCMHMTGDELTTLRHMIDHFVGFKRCHFCQQPQSNFNGYMQHCYADHREGINRFSEIYKQQHIMRYLQQMLIIFPNGLVFNKKNLRFTKYGSEARINLLYAEICKTAKEPPIPRLSIARLVARKSIEAQQSLCSVEGQSGNHDDRFMSSTSTAAAMQLAGNGNTIPSDRKLQTAKRICKRRSTVAFGLDDGEQMPTAYLGMFGYKKKKSPPVPPFSPPPPTFQLAPETVTTNSGETEDSVTNPASQTDEDATVSVTESVETELKPYSFYGTKPDPIDLSKIHTRIAVAGKDTPLSLKKFQLLFKIDCRVMIEQCDLRKYIIESQGGGKRLRKHLDDEGDNDDTDDSITYRHIKKPCPASHKYKYKFVI